MTKNSSGTNVGGSIGHDGSTNTLYLTGLTSGAATQHLSIDSSGNVGVGTSSPEVSFHVVSSNYQAAKLESTAANADGAYLELYANSASPAANDTLGIISYRGNDSGGNELTYAHIRS